MGKTAPLLHKQHATKEPIVCKEEKGKDSLRSICQENGYDYPRKLDVYQTFAAQGTETEFPKMGNTCVDQIRIPKTTAQKDSRDDKRDDTSMLTFSHILVTIT